MLNLLESNIPSPKNKLMTEEMTNFVFTHYLKLIIVPFEANLHL